MSPPIRAVSVALVVVASLFLAIGSIQWAKRHATGAQIVASALTLVLGISQPIAKIPQQELEEVREHKGRKGSESGDPPAA